MSNFLGSVGNFVTSAVSNTFSFAGSAIRNTLTFASNVLPDAGVLGDVGDWAGNALTFGSGPVYSGGGSGGSFLTPLGIGPQVGAAQFIMPKFSPFAGASESLVSKVDSGPTAESPSSVVPSTGGKPTVPSGGSAPAGVSPPPSAAFDTAYEALHAATTAPKWNALDTRVEGITDADRARAVAGHVRNAAIQGNAMEGTVSSQITGILGSAYLDELSLLETQANTGKIDASLLRQYETKAASVDRLLGNPSKDAILGGIHRDSVLQVSSALKPIDVSVGEAVAKDPLVQQFNSDVKQYNERLQVVEALVRANGGEFSQEALAHLSILYAAGGALADQQLALRSKTYRDGWSRMSYDGTELGVDLEYVGQWVQWLTPFALAGIQYAWQSSVDDKNRKWQEKVRAEDREFEERMMSMRLSAEERIAGIRAEGSSPAAVGASSGVTINAGTASA